LGGDFNNSGTYNGSSFNAFSQINGALNNSGTISKLGSPLGNHTSHIGSINNSGSIEATGNVISSGNLNNSGLLSFSRPMENGGLL
jgi:hypothetical protein